MINYNRLFYNILITTDCNLRCTYCYEKNKYKSVIDIDIAKKFIDFVFDKKYYLEDREFENVLCFKLMGGELLLYPELLDEIITYLTFKGVLNNIVIKILFSTNGTNLGNKKVKQFLKKWKNVFLVTSISLDGTPKVNDMNRIFKDGTGSSAHILHSIKYLRHDLGISDVLTNYSYVIAFDKVKYVEESFVWFSKFTKYVSFLIQDNGISLNTMDVYKELDNQFGLFRDYLIENKEKFNLFMISKEEVTMQSLPNRSNCKAELCSGYELCVDTQGNLIPCASFNDTVLSDNLSLGNIKDLNSIDIHNNSAFDDYMKKATEFIKNVDCNVQFCPARVIEQFGKIEKINVDCLKSIVLVLNKYVNCFEQLGLKAYP
jgi:uncharacterized protein